MFVVRVMGITHGSEVSGTLRRITLESRDSCVSELVSPRNLEI